MISTEIKDDVWCRAGYGPVVRDEIEIKDDVWCSAGYGPVVRDNWFCSCYHIKAQLPSYLSVLFFYH